ncbi:MAG: hypothetical protein ACPLRU_01120, partial [Desulfofundulus sp.]
MQHHAVVHVPRPRLDPPVLAPEGVEVYLLSRPVLDDDFPALDYVRRQAPDGRRRAGETGNVEITCKVPRKMKDALESAPRSDGTYLHFFA